MILSFRELQHSIPSRSGAYSHSDKDVKLGLHTYIIYYFMLETTLIMTVTDSMMLQYAAICFLHTKLSNIPAQCSFRWWVWFAHSKLVTMSLEMFGQFFLTDHVVLTSFGPSICVYVCSSEWTQT